MVLPCRTTTRIRTLGCCWSVGRAQCWRARRRRGAESGPERAKPAYFVRAHRHYGNDISSESADVTPPFTPGATSHYQLAAVQGRNRWQPNVHIRSVTNRGLSASPRNSASGMPERRERVGSCRCRLAAFRQRKFTDRFPAMNPKTGRSHRDPVPSPAALRSGHRNRLKPLFKLRH
jgi:hypothetical protein